MYTMETLKADGILFTFEVTYDKENGAYAMQTDNGWYECKMCKEFKERSQFTNRLKGSNSFKGRSTYCRECEKFRKLVFKLSNPAAYNAIVARNNKKIKLKRMQGIAK